MFTLFEFINSLVPFGNATVILVWATVAGAVSMITYSRFSPQRRLKAIKRCLSIARRQLNAYDGPFDGLWPLIKRNLKLSLHQVALSFGPSILAAVPLILIMICLDHQLHNAVDNGSMVEAKERRAVSRAKTSESPTDPELPVTPVATRRNEAPPAQSGTRHQEYLAFGPDWMRSWVFLFLLGSTSSALLVRQVGKIR